MPTAEEFSWIPLYEEFATRLLEYQDNRRDLVQVVQRAYQNAALNMPKLESSPRLLDDIDPFTVFGTFNKGMSDVNRKKLLTSYKEELRLASALPSSFGGIPVLNNTNAAFYLFKDHPDRGPHDIDWLWDLFYAALVYADNPSEEAAQQFVVTYARAREQKGNKSKLSIALYWIRPYTYLSLDSKNRQYLTDPNTTFLPEKLVEIIKRHTKDLPPAEEYLALCSNVLTRLNQDNLPVSNFPSLSLQAWRTSRLSNKEKTRKEGASLSQKNELISGVECNPMSSSPLNLILYGPPGTGKTYSTVDKAIEIINGYSPNREHDEAANLYHKYVGEGRIGFATFHQSFSYEDFIEGIRPTILDSEDEESSGALTYGVQPGIFKKFCDRAAISETRKHIKGLGENPTVWKVSLKSTGENEIRRDCFRNGRIRIGYADIDVEALNDLPRGTEGKGILKAFYSDMKIGDIVCSCWSNHETDGIGIITGHANYDASLGDYPNIRSVQWLTGKELQDHPLDITELNGGTTLTLASIYKLNRISPEELFEKAGISGTANNNHCSDPYVFIIDEINRGNVSAIFGECITLLEESKRIGAKDEQRVILPYSGERWGIPSNVYVIGTMNTADRSLTQLDTALRRRFTFEEVMPDSGQIKNRLDDVNLQLLLDTINQRIEALYDREHTIGHAYLMGIGTLENLRGVFSTKIIPLLQEYFFEDWERIRIVLNDVDGTFIEKTDSNFATLNLSSSSWGNSISDDELRPCYRVRDSSQWTASDFRAIYEKNEQGANEHDN